MRSSTGNIAGLWGTFLLSLIFITGCNSGGGPDVTAKPQFQPAPDLRSLNGHSQPVAVKVIDARQTKPPVRPDGREVIAEGDKGKVFLPQTAPSIIQSSLESAFRDAGFNVTPDAPVVVEATLIDLPLTAYQFTHWNLPSERASTLDALGAVIPSPVRPTEAKAAMNVVIRKGDARLGFSHTVTDAVSNKSDDRSVVEKTLGQVISDVVNKAVAESAPDVEIVARTPVTTREINQRADELDRQNKDLARVNEALTSQQAALTEDRAALASMRQKLESDRAALQQEQANARETVAAREKALEQQRADLAAQRQSLQAKADDLARKLTAAANQPKDSPENQEARAALAEVRRQQQDLDKKSAALASASHDLEARKKAIDERENNLAAYAAQLDHQSKANQDIAAQLEQQRLDLKSREQALEKWKQDLQARADVKPPPSVTTGKRPLVIITEPATASTDTTLPRLPIRGAASDDRQIASLRATVNGKTIDLLKSPTTAPAASQTLAYAPIDFQADLREGKNDIAIEATDDERLTTTENLTINYDKGAGRIHVLTIGINDYSHQPAVPELHYAVADAHDIASTLSSLFKDPNKQVTELLDQQASKAKVIDELFHDLPSEVKPADTVVIFFSGHGAPGTTTDAQGNVDTYILPIDADPASLVNTAIKMSDLDKVLRRLRSERIVFLADTCYSGAGGRGIKTVDMRAASGVALRAVLGTRAVPKLPEGKGCALITAATASQVAQEQETFGHGIFTYYLLQGLKGAADTNRDGNVTVTELYTYVRNQVEKSTAGAQTPQLTLDRSAAGNIVLSRVGK